MSQVTLFPDLALDAADTSAEVPAQLGRESSGGAAKTAADVIEIRSNRQIVVEEI